VIQGTPVPTFASGVVTPHTCKNSAAKSQNSPLLMVNIFRNSKDSKRKLICCGVMESWMPFPFGEQTVRPIPPRERYRNGPELKNLLSCTSR